MILNELKSEMLLEKAIEYHKNNLLNENFQSFDIFRNASFKC